jgi:hypothetical protein
MEREGLQNRPVLCSSDKGISDNFVAVDAEGDSEASRHYRVGYNTTVRMQHLSCLPTHLPDDVVQYFRIQTDP